MHATAAAAQITGIDVSVLDAWTKPTTARGSTKQVKAVFVPTVASGGRGSRREYSFADLVALRCAFHLRQAAIPLNYVRLVAGEVRKLSGLAGPVHRAMQPTSVISDGATAWVEGKRPKARAASGPPSIFVTIQVERVEREVAQRCVARLRV